MKAKFYDGVYSRAYQVSITLGTRSLMIRSDCQTIQESWDYKDVELAQSWETNRPANIKNTKYPMKRLLLETESSYHFFLKGLPRSHRATIERKHRYGWLISLIVLLSTTFVFGILFIFKFESFLPYIPEKWDRKIGQLASQQILKDQEVCASKEIDRVLQTVLQRMVAPLPNKETWHLKLTIIDAPSIENAVALPGGQVFLYSGLIDQAKHQDMLIGVIAHEIGHVYHRHGMSGLVRNFTLTAAASLMGALVFSDVSSFAWLAQLGVELASLKHSRAHENQADQFALELLQKLKLSSAGLAYFFMGIEKESMNIEYLSTHPVTRNRIERIEKHPTFQLKGRALISQQEWQILKAACTKKHDLKPSKHAEEKSKKK
jgi:beta-barrel assembly-enhancing protease